MSLSLNSHIEWTDATWNPVRGCTRVIERQPEGWLFHVGLGSLGNPED